MSNSLNKLVDEVRCANENEASNKFNSQLEDLLQGLVEEKNKVKFETLLKNESFYIPKTLAIYFNCLCEFMEQVGISFEDVLSLPLNLSRSTSLFNDEGEPIFKIGICFEFNQKCLVLSVKDDNVVDDDKARVEIAKLLGFGKPKLNVDTLIENILTSDLISYFTVLNNFFQIMIDPGSFDTGKSKRLVIQNGEISARYEKSKIAKAKFDLQYNQGLNS